MLGYFMLGVTVLFCAGLALFTASQPSLSGDRAMGYGLGLFFLTLCFGVSSLVLTILILAKGSFNWVASDAGARTALVLLTWVCIVATTFFCAVFKWEWHSNTDNTYPQFLRWIAVGHGQFWIPMIWLTACFLSLNTSSAATISPYAHKGSFFAALLISGLYSGGLLMGYLRDSSRQMEARQAAQKAREDQWHQQTLAFIDSQKPEDPIVNLLAHTNQFQESDVRQAALGKIKRHTDWENELLALLKTERLYREVYYFLDGNAVDHPDQFVEPLNQSILQLAADIRADIKNSNNLQSWSFGSHGISQLLRALDQQFQGKSDTFYPAVQKLRQSLNTPPPERFKGVTFDVTHDIDAWLSRHKK